MTEAETMMMVVPPGSSARPSKGAMRVLVVEDSSIGRKVLAAALGKLEAELTWAENGLEGVKAYQEQPFDVVLMDLQMPVMDGYTATREIRALEASAGKSRTPVVVVSAHTRPVDVRASMDAGADHHLGKPFNVPALLGTIEALVDPV